MSQLSPPGPLTRRVFLGAAGAGLFLGCSGRDEAPATSPALEKAVARLGPYITTQDDFRDVSRGRPLPHSLPQAKKRAVGLTRETWKLDVLSDPDHPTKIERPLTRKAGTAIDFKALLKLADTRAVRVLKVMTCLNIGCPLGMGLWEGVPLRDVLWMTTPTRDLRRVWFHGYHNDDPKQMFRSSLPAGRVLEDYHGLPPVLLCYKLNGQWLTSERGGPVRVLVPEGYGFKSIKWLSHVYLSNIGLANDTYLGGNNDVDSPLKTFAATLEVARGARAGQPFPVTGYAQVGVSGMSKVQVWVSPKGQKWSADDPYFTKAPWADATILPPPKEWKNLPGGALPKGTFGVGPDGKPKSWPMPLTRAFWAKLLPGLPAGEYTLRCRSVDGNGVAQPMPRPFRKSGHCDIESVSLTVKA